MTTLRTRTLATLLATMVLAGCNSMTKLPANQTGDASAPPEFNLVTDIPIPAGATMDNDRSLILSDRDRWTGRVVMKTWKPVTEATAFYQNQMPTFGWEPVMSVTSDISVLSYIRGDRAATVQIEKSNLWGASVSVTVAPRQSGVGNSPYSAQPAYSPQSAPPGHSAYGQPVPVRPEPLR